jgi:hypothetical protein
MFTANERFVLHPTQIYQNQEPVLTRSMSKRKSRYFEHQPLNPPDALSILKEPPPNHPVMIWLNHLTQPQPSHPVMVWVEVTRNRVFIMDVNKIECQDTRSDCGMEMPD